ncbi:hypothetical protein ACV07N_14710 [Roseivirga echinicomitans]
MKAQNYNRVLTAFAFVGVTAIMALLIDNFSGQSTANSQGASDQSESSIQLKIDDTFDQITNNMAMIKVFNAQDALIAEFVEGEALNDETLKIYRKADFLSKFNNLTIYKLSE